MNANERQETLLAIYGDELPKEQHTGIQVTHSIFGERVYQDGWLVGSSSWVLKCSETEYDYEGYKILTASITMEPGGKADFFLSYRPEWDLEERAFRVMDRNPSMSRDTEKELIASGQL